MIPVVDLNRSFVGVSRLAPRNSVVSLSRATAPYSWDHLLRRYRVVLLAEAASGKTTEFRTQAQRLGALGHPAFFVTVETLAELGFHAALSKTEQERFARWSAMTQHAWFFVDSLDEARLTRRNFGNALKTLAAQIGEHAERAHIYLSCRASDWRGNEDLEVLNSVFPPVRTEVPVESLVTSDTGLLAPVLAPRKFLDDWEKPADPEPQPLIVRFVPLELQQCRALADAAGVEDLDAFMDAIERHGLEGFSERPGDLLDLAAYWRTRRRFASVSVMIDQSIHLKLLEYDSFRPDNELLTPHRARTGAQRIAAALTLGKSRSVRVPGNSSTAPHSSAIDPCTVLDDWTDAERNALLRRGIFAPSTYGQVAFHHRSSQEYLTAQWFQQLLDMGCPRSVVWDLLFDQPDGIPTIVPSLRPVAAWLSLGTPEIREEVIARDPTLLCFDGDPSSLPLDTKGRMLKTWAQKHATGELSGLPSSRKNLRLFAEPQLADAIREAWYLNPSPDFRSTLLQIIDAGSVTRCFDLLRGVVSDESENDSMRKSALEVLCAHEDREWMRVLGVQLASSPARFSDDLAAAAAVHLFPDYLNVDQLLALLVHGREQRHWILSFVMYIPQMWNARIDEQCRRRLALGLADLCAVIADPVTRSQFAGLVSLIDDLQSKQSACGLPPEYAKLLLAIQEAKKPSPQHQAHSSRYITESGAEIRIGERGDQDASTWLALRDELQERLKTNAASDSPGTALQFAELLALTRWLEFRTGGKNVTAALRWPLLAEGFGPEVAQAYKRGLECYWRKTEPGRPVYSSDGKSLRVRMTAELALAGIAIEASTDADWVARLTDDETERALRHWCGTVDCDMTCVDALVEGRPTVALPILRAELEQEWLSPQAGFPSLLRYYAAARNGQPRPIPEAVQRILCEIISAHEPGMPVLHSVATMVLRGVDFTGPERERFDTLMQLRLERELEIIQEHEVPASLGALYLANPTRAVDKLCAMLERVGTSARIRRATEAFYVIFDWNYPSALKLAERASLEDLERLVRLAYRYVPPSGDVNHMSFVEPEQRKPAQNARQAIRDVLIAKSAPHGIRLLRGWQSGDVPEALRLEAHRLALELAADKSETPPWTAAQVLALERQHSLALNTGSALLHAVCAVLDDIQADLSRADASSRRLLEVTPDEAATQGWLAEQLKLRARKRFHVYREVTVAQDNIPDIVVASTTAPVEVAIEVKLCGKYSTQAQLRRALQEQLVGKYLRTGSRRHGVLVLTYHAERRWRAQSGGTVSFETLLTELKAIAGTLMERSTNPIDVRVMGIDVARRPEQHR